MSLIGRLAKKLGISENKARKVRTAFVEALVEEVEARFGPCSCEHMATEPMRQVPVVVTGLGSFKLRKRPARTFMRVGNIPMNASPNVVKPPARRLVMSAKWKDL